MNMAGAWAMFVLVASVASNPLMKYSFCPLSDARCKPKTLASDSSLDFGNITSGVYYYEPGETKVLSVSCTFHQPLHWILTANDVVRVNSISTNVTINGSQRLYYYHIHFNEASSGLIRCESYNDPDLAAEIFIARRDPDYDYVKVDYKLLSFFPTATSKRGGKFIVPCAMYRFDSSFNPTTIRLKKLRRSDMIAPAITRECLSCFPYAEHSEATPYNISQVIWNMAGQPLGVNKTGNQWLDCVRDPECALKTATKVLMSEKHDCNGDGEKTCSDYISTLASYPSTCKSGSVSNEKFREVEACIVETFGQLLNLTEADYDPRLGFRLNTEQDVDAVYVCPLKIPGVYYSPYDPSKKIDVRLQKFDNTTNEHLMGIYCIVPQKWMEDFRMMFLSCSTLHDCELQLQTVEVVNTNLRKSNVIVNGKEISEISPRLYGKIITNPPQSGVAQCKAQYRFETGYILDLQYFFIGLDSKSYFLSDSRIPVEALISIKSVQVQTNLTASNGFEMEVECTVATFIMFPNFEFIVEYSNGTTSKNEQTFGFHKMSHNVSQRLKLPANDGASVVSIRCRALFRNSEKYEEAFFKIGSDVNDPLLEADQNVSQEYVVAIFTGTSIVLVLGAVICAIYGVTKYKKSKEVRQLTLDEINEFLNGNAAITTASANEWNLVGFAHTQEVLGEGEFGRCVCGDFHEQKVAVKTTKASMDVEAFKEFLREVKIMAYLGKHENIIEFLGAVVNQLRDRICIAVVELSPYGDLLSYLRHNDVENPGNVGLYTNLPCAKLEISHLSYFCEQIAAAMEFVVEKRVIHGDLAARNVLVFPDYVVKITDFGLSRKMYTASNYKKKNTTPLPWRWMAIESLKYMEFSPMTDMWAYGVTAWEIFSLGEVPYPGVVYSHEFVNEVDGGRRLPWPKNASEEIYQFMKLTWDRIPSARPSFKDAKNLFSRLSLRSQ